MGARRPVPTSGCRPHRCRVVADTTTSAHTCGSHRAPHAGWHRIYGILATYLSVTASALSQVTAVAMFQRYMSPRALQRMLTPSEWLTPQFINFLVQQRIDNINEQAVLAMKRARKAKASAAVHKRAQRSAARAPPTLISGERQDAYVRELVIPGTPVRACTALEQAATQARAEVTCVHMQCQALWTHQHVRIWLPSLSLRARKNKQNSHV